MNSHAGNASLVEPGHESVERHKVGLDVVVPHAAEEVHRFLPLQSLHQTLFWMQLNDSDNNDNNDLKNRLEDYQ